MTPSDIVLECEKRGIQLRVNPVDKKLTATPRKSVPSDLLVEMQKQRPELIAYLEEMARMEGELTIDDITPAPPPPPTVPELILAKAAEANIKITIFPDTAEGMLKVITPWTNIADEVPDIIKDHPGVDNVGRQRMPIPHALAGLIQSHTQELTQHLRAKHMPPPPPPDPNAPDPSQRSIWERMARPDNLIPGAKDNQDRVRTLLFGENAGTRVLKDRLESVDRSLIALTIPKLKGKK